MEVMEVKALLKLKSKLIVYNHFSFIYSLFSELCFVLFCFSNIYIKNGFKVKLFRENFQFLYLKNLIFSHFDNDFYFIISNDYKIDF
jgi:hypothetical protein